eukprot:TRINITY_DN1946_c0_g1_i1.p1 TRINITY_DN1946_c0_g1~~TRINITY_DN1946_c0_g1_i1.p1  ORF type:complete len:331 (+),score=73.94 TRINITY_DN1946_c0_g1_i1:143-1135(+)
MGSSKRCSSEMKPLLVLLLMAASSTAEWNEHEYLRREHSLIKPYQSTGFGIPNWDFTGSTMITSNYVRLTPDTQSNTGLLWNTVPVMTPNWELQVVFKVSGTTKDLFGDGFAIWYTQDRMRGGPVFGSKDLFSGLAVIADTYSNHNGPHNHDHPYLSAMINNGSLHYDHDRDGTHTMIGGCEVKFRNKDYETRIAIKYENDVLTVSHDLSNDGAWTQCFSVEGVKLPTGYYIGASATTGELSDSHDIISMRLYELEVPTERANQDRSNIQPSSAFFASPRDHVDDPKPSSMSGVKMFFILLIGLLGCVACVVVGIMIYQKQQDNSSKRFY